MRTLNLADIEGWKVVDIDFYVILRAGTWPRHCYLDISFYRKTVSATFQPSELHNNLCRPLSIPQKTCVGHFPTIRPQIELCRSLSNPQKNIAGQLTTLFFRSYSVGKLKVPRTHVRCTLRPCLSMCITITIRV